MLGAAISIRNLKLRHDLCPQSKEEDTDNTHSFAVPQATCKISGIDIIKAVEMPRGQQ